METMSDECKTVSDDCEDQPLSVDSLPPGIKTEAVLMLLGNISNALNEMVAGINGTITQIITDGSKMEHTEEQGEMFDGKQDS